MRRRERVRRDKSPLHNPMQNRPIRTVNWSKIGISHPDGQVGLSPCFPACIAIYSVKRHAGKNDGQSRERLQIS